MGREEASQPWRRAQPQGCRGQSGEIPAQRIAADQHSPAREACLLTRRGGWGLGDEAWASEVGSQGEDWGWQREHILKGATAPQLAGRESGKNSGPTKRQETIVSGCVRRGDSFPVCPQKAEHHLNKLQRLERAMAISLDTRDRHEMLRLLLQPSRILCSSTGHNSHAPPTPRPGSLCSTPLPGSHDPGTNSPGEHTACLRLLQHHASLCHCRLIPHSNYNYRIPPSPALSEPESPNQPLF